MNLFDAGMPTPEETVDVLYEKNGTRIERITSWHHATPRIFGTTKTRTNGSCF